MRRTGRRSLRVRVSRRARGPRLEDDQRAVHARVAQRVQVLRLRAVVGHRDVAAGALAQRRRSAARASRAPSCSASSRRRSAARGPRRAGRCRRCRPDGAGRGFGHCQIGSKSTCLPWYSRLVVGPDRLHGLDALAHVAVARRGVGAVVEHLLLVPARADAEHEAPAGERSAARRSAWPARSGRARSPGRRSCRSISFSVAAAANASATNGSWVRRYFSSSGAAVAGDHPGRDRDVRVLGDEQRLVAALPRPRGRARRGGSRRR